MSTRPWHTPPQHARLVEQSLCWRAGPLVVTSNASHAHRQEEPEVSTEDGGVTSKDEVCLQALLEMNFHQTKILMLM